MEPSTKEVTRCVAADLIIQAKVKFIITILLANLTHLASLLLCDAALQPDDPAQCMPEYHKQ
jgi:hypothetical protein